MSCAPLSRHSHADVLSVRRGRAVLSSRPVRPRVSGAGAPVAREDVPGLCITEQELLSKRVERLRHVSVYSWVLPFRRCMRTMHERPHCRRDDLLQHVRQTVADVYCGREVVAESAGWDTLFSRLVLAQKLNNFCRHSKAFVKRHNAERIQFLLHGLVCRSHLPWSLQAVHLHVAL